MVMQMQQRPLRNGGLPAPPRGLLMSYRHACLIEPKESVSAIWRDLGAGENDRVLVDGDKSRRTFTYGERTIAVKGETHQG